MGSGIGIGAGLGGVGNGGSGIGPGPGGTGLGGAGEGGGGTGSGLGTGEGEGTGMVAVGKVRKFAEQALIFMVLVPRPEVTYIPGKGSGRPQCPDVFEWRQSHAAPGSSGGNLIPVCNLVEPVFAPEG
jgi:hypothetical protein